MARAADDLRRLARELASLTPDDRERVLGMLGEREPPAPTPARPVSWERLRRLNGLVQLGGHAVKDCDALYDA
jgi:hypothetical protein